MGDIYLVNVDGTCERRLTSFRWGAGSPAWSPDGKRIAFHARSESHGLWEFDIFVINADASGLANLTETPGDEMEPSYSPDGQKIAFASWEGICVMNTDGTEREVLVPNGHRLHFAPTWSPDGQWIAFHSFRDGEDWQIYAVRSDGSNLTRLTDLGIYGVSRPAWSPDGREIVFECGEFICVLDIETREVATVVAGKEPNWHQ